MISGTVKISGQPLPSVGHGWQGVRSVASEHGTCSDGAYVIVCLIYLSTLQEGTRTGSLQKIGIQ